MKRCQCFSKSLEDRAGVSVDAGIMKEWAGRTLTLLKNKIKFWIPSGKPLCNRTRWGLIGQDAALPMGQELSVALAVQESNLISLSKTLKRSCREVWAALFSQ